MIGVEKALFHAQRDHHRDRLPVKHHRGPAVATHWTERHQPSPAHLRVKILADQNRLAGAQHVFGNMVSRGPRAFRQALAIFDLQLVAHFAARLVVHRDEKVIDVQQALHLGINFFKQRFGVQRRAQRAADFV